MKNHLLSGQAFGLMSGDRPLFHATAPGGHEALHAELTRRKIPFHPVQGKYGEPERSFFLPGISEEALRDLGERYGQESVIHSMGGKNRLLFTNGPRRGQSQHGHGYEVFDQPPEDMYTEMPGQGFFRLNLQGGTPHPHSYSWHDGHTSHHQSIKKAHENEQFAPAGASTYHEFAQHYGGIGKPGAQNLKFYDYAGKGQAVNDLLRQHGFTPYYAGGKHGAPDLANRNYNTKHLMIYDPDPGSGGDFGEREYTDSWRKVHELAHALTYPQLNAMYGEGRRIGKLGVHRTPNEALRAVHWEHLAAHKQRELSAQLGVHVPDPDFNREYNTVMHDAAHRAVTGKFTDPNEEGFQPHHEAVPLSTSMALVQGHAARMGLHPHETLKTKAQPAPVAKAEVQDQHAIYTYVRGQVSMADAKNEKLYSPEEARDILLKAAREKIDVFAKEIEGLRKRELGKALIPVHAHKGASSASGGVEDVPAADMGKAEALCKKCGKAHGLEKGCAAKDEMAKGSGPTHVCNYPACGKGIKGDKDFCNAHSGKPVKKDEAKESPAYGTVSDGKPEGEKSSSDAHQDNLEKVTPPGISEKTMHKLKREYGGDKEKAYATAWSIHNKVKKALEKATQMEKLPPEATAFPTPRGPANQGSVEVDRGPQNMSVGEGMVLDRSMKKTDEWVDNQGHMVENGIDPAATLPPKASGKARSKGVVPQHDEKNGQIIRGEESNGSGGAVLPGAKLKRNPDQKAKDASARQFSDKGDNDPYVADSGPSDNGKTYDKRGEGKDAPGPGTPAGDKTYTKRGEGANDKTYKKSVDDGVKKPASAAVKDWMKKPSKPEASAIETSVSSVAKTAGGMAAPAMAKPPKMGAAPGTSSTGAMKPPAMKAEYVEKGLKDKIAAAALAAGTALTAGAIPAAHHEGAKRVESRVKLPGAHLRPADPALPMAQKSMAKGSGRLDTWAGEGVPEKNEVKDAPKRKYTMQDLKDAKAKLVPAPKSALKSENDALRTDAPSKKDSGENSALRTDAPGKVAAKNKGLDAAPASKKDSGKNDALVSDAASSKESGKNDVLHDAPPSGKDSGENSALEDAAPMKKGWKGAMAGAALAAGTALTGGMVKPHMDATAAKVQSQIKPQAQVGTLPLPSQRPQLSARPGPLAMKPSAAPAPKKPGIFGKLQGK